MIEIFSCPLCGSADHTPLYERPGVKVSFCHACGFGFLKEQMTDEEAERFYATEFQDKRRALSTVQEAVDRLLIKKSYEGKLQAIPFFTTHLKSGMEVLEVGSGWGTLSKVLFDRLGCVMTALEPSILATQVAREYYHLNALQSTLAQFIEHNPEKKFDAVVLYHVFEHLSHPRQTLKEIQSVLKQGGLLFLALPNLARPTENPQNFFHRGHLSYFSPATLYKILVENGFSVVHYREDVDDLKMISCMVAPGAGASTDALDPDSVKHVTPEKTLKAVQRHLLGYKIRALIIPASVRVWGARQVLPVLQRIKKSLQ